MVDERVEKLHAVRGVTTHSILVERIHQVLVFRVVSFDGVVPFLAAPVLGDDIEDFHLIVSRFKVMLGTFLHLDGNIAIILQILRQPNRREVAPAELLDDYVPIEQDLTDMHRVISTDLVIRHAFVLARVLFIEEIVFDLIFQRSEIWPIGLALVLASVGRAWTGVMALIIHELRIVSWLVVEADFKDWIGPSLILLFLLIALFLFLLWCLIFLLAEPINIQCLIIKFPLLKLLPRAGFYDLSIQFIPDVIVGVPWVILEGRTWMEEDFRGAFLIKECIGIVFWVFFVSSIVESRWRLIKGFCRVLGVITRLNCGHRAHRDLHGVGYTDRSSHLYVIVFFSVDHEIVLHHFRTFGWRCKIAINFLSLGH